MKRPSPKPVRTQTSTKKIDEATPPKLDMPVNMVLDDKKENIVVEEEMEKQVLNGKRKREVHLDKKPKKTYDIEDTTIRDISISGDIHFRLISNINGYYIDIRKYYKEYPTKKGIRMLAAKFVTACNIIKTDLDSLIPQQKSDTQNA